MLKRKLDSAEDTDAKKLKLDDQKQSNVDTQVALVEAADDSKKLTGLPEEVDNEIKETDSDAKKEGVKEAEVEEDDAKKDNAQIDAKEKESSPESKPVFGATSSFGNASIFDKIKSKPNVFDSLPLKSESNDAGKASFGSSFGLFGASSKFANALQRATEKKSFLDHPEDKDVGSKSLSEIPKATQQYKQVELVAQDVKTGEENEKSLYSVTAKLFELDLTKLSEGWKERGLGPLHLNQSLVDPSQVRIVMRSQGLLRVILNYRITSTTVLIKGLEASLSPGKFLRFNSVSAEGKPVQYLIKLANESLRDGLVYMVNDLRSSTKSNGTRAGDIDSTSTQEPTDEDTGDEH